MKLRSNILSLLFVLFIFLSCSALVSAEPVTINAQSSSDRLYFDTLQSASEYIRDGVINHDFHLETDEAYTVSVAIPASAAENSADIHSYVYFSTVEHTGNPIGGDYATIEFSFEDLDIRLVDEFWFVNFRVKYLLTYDQHQEMNSAVNHVLQELNIDNASDYEKVRAIYDWICYNVKYLISSSDPLCSSAYGALCKDGGTCQSYSRLFYRLCLEVGLDCRYVSGIASTMHGQLGHAWNVVQVDGKYYQVDSTWGAGMFDFEPDYYYFLKGVRGFGDHIPVRIPSYDGIDGYCTLAEDDYPIPEKFEIIRAQVSPTISVTATRDGYVTIEGTGALTSLPSIQGLHVIDVTIQEGITSIGSNIFYDVARIQFPNSLECIEEAAFPNFWGFSIYIPANVKTLNPINGPCLTNLTLDPQNPYYTSIDGVIYTKDMKTLVMYGNSSKMFEIPFGVNKIGKFAFSGNTSLDHVIIPSSVSIIDDYAFYNTLCDQVDLTDNIVYIGDYAFYDCNGLFDLYIGESVSYIGNEAIQSMKLESITVNPNNQFFTSVDDVLYSKDMTQLIKYPCSKPAKSFTIPNGVVSIADGAFRGFLPFDPDDIYYEIDPAYSDGPNLKEIIFPETLETIGQSSFADMKNLTAIHLPSNLKSIGNNAFFGVNKPERITIPDSVITIGDSAFYGNEFKTVNIGSGVQSVGPKAFMWFSKPEDGNTQIMKVYFKGTPPAIAINDTYGVTFACHPGFNGKFTASEHAIIYAPREYSEYWVPNGESLWIPNLDYKYETYNDNIYDSYPIQCYYNTATCSYVGVPIPPVCNEDGYINYRCIECGNTFTDIIKSNGSNGHSWQITDCLSSKTCIICGTISEIPRGHSWILYPDTNTKTCRWCGVVEEYIFHTFGSWQTITDPTCTQEGTMQRLCSVCDHIQIDIVPIIDHTWLEGSCYEPRTCAVCGGTDGQFDHKYDQWVVITEATCTQVGWEESICSICGNPWTLAGQEIPITEHKWKSATCTSPKICEFCGLTDGTILGHTEAIDKAVAATCTTAGKTEGKHCSVCGAVLVAQQNVSAKGHTYTNDQDTTCDTCGYVREIAAPEHQHSYQSVVTAPTCSKQGYTTYTCSCGDNYKDAFMDSTGHSWKDATCTAPKTCKVCGATSGEAKGHDWAAGNCTTPKTCKTCGVKDGGVVHSYDSQYDYKCNVCNKERTVDMTRPMVDMFRMYDPNSGEHFYTGSMEERENLVAVGWQYEGVGFTFPLTTGKPVHRLYDPVTGEHLYTMDEDEMNMLLAQGWNYEGIAFNSGFENEVPQYRLHNPNATRGAYHFTASLEERDMLIALGWEYQGIGWYSLGG